MADANTGKELIPPTKYVSPIAIAIPPLARIQPPKLSSLQTAAQEFQNLQNFFQSALLECIQTIERAFNTITANNPFVQRMRCLSHKYKNLFQVRCQRRGKPNPLTSCSFAAILAGDSVAGLVVTNGITNFLNIYNTLLIVRLVLTWFPNSPPQIVSPLSTLCDPYLNIFRGIIPPLGGTLDLSPILAFFVLSVFTNVAAALPAELPRGEESMQGSGSIPIQYPNLSAKQKLWLKRHGSSSDQKKDDHNN